MERIVIVGTTGVGKSTLAKRLSVTLGIPSVDLDDLYWRENWTPADPEEFSRMLDTATQGPRWIATGNYGKYSGYMHWRRANTLIWLDYSFPRAFRQLLLRSITRMCDKKPICNGNVEKLSNFFSRDSIMLWLFKTYWRRRHEIPELLARPEHKHLKIYRFRKPAETEVFLAGLKP